MASWWTPLELEPLDVPVLRNEAKRKRGQLPRVPVSGLRAAQHDSVISSGTSGTVHRVFWNGVACAAKLFHAHVYNDKQVQREVASATFLQHVCVVRVLAVVVKDPPPAQRVGDACSEANMRDAFQPANLRHLPSHVALVGDVLFRGSIGRTDFPRGNHDQLIDAIRNNLFPLGDDITFVPGHGPLSTFGAERRSNPYVSDLALGA